MATIPLIIVTRPERSIAELRSALQHMVGAEAAAEIRIDRLPESELDRLDELFPSPVPLVATYRSRAEGGAGRDVGTARSDVLRRLLSLPFSYVDLEARSDVTLVEAAAARTDGPRLIVSTHIPERASLDEIEAALALRGPVNGWTKFVIPSTLDRFYREIRPLVVSSRSPSSPRIVHTTGPSGPILRARAAAFGFAGVFAGPALNSNVATVEPSQLPFDALSRYISAGSAGRLFALLGHPVDHSFSPRIHAQWYRTLNEPGLYVALDVLSEEEFVHVLGHLNEDGFIGLNVTHPWKGAALGAASRASNAARAAGCANTLTYDGGGWFADNFDVDAVERRLRELRDGGAWPGSDLLVLGSGGAARATVLAADRLGLRASILARDPRRVRTLVRDLGAVVPERPDSPASLIVQTTPVGRSDAGTLELPWEAHLRAGTYFLDFVYRPDESMLRTRVESRQGIYEDGSRLLVYQAVETHRRWWGIPPRPESVDGALKEMGCTA